MNRADMPMGQEIDHVKFSDDEYAWFHQRLIAETRLLGDWLEAGRFSSHAPMGGFELEAWLVDGAMQPVADNVQFLAELGDPQAGPELAQFNIEFNSDPVALNGSALRQAQTHLEEHWQHAMAIAESLGYQLLLIGTLPTLSAQDLNLDNLSALKRYQALNEQILAARAGRPIRLDIVGRQHLRHWHQDLMLEAASTSFQIHWQVDWQKAHRYYNAAVMASAAVAAVGSNSPYLFGRDLWAETRIPLFEQAVGIGGYEATIQGPLRRAGFGCNYARNSLIELFRENLEHFPVILPILFDSTEAEFAHLRLHNGTIWRWNRPIVGFDIDQRPHLRIEHRVLPAGPSFADMFANAAFFYGLVEFEVHRGHGPAMPFAQARDNFYLAAQHGLNGHGLWQDGDKQRFRHLITDRLLPQAAEGLRRLDIDAADIDQYLGIVRERCIAGQTGSQWQRQFIERHPGNFEAMTQTYCQLQRSGMPVHEWRSK